MTFLLLKGPRIKVFSEALLPKVYITPIEHAVNPSMEAWLPHPCGKQFDVRYPAFALVSHTSEDHKITRDD
ncbi:hypothetical protein B9G39_10375 [Zooshikella ganghwensis]|uniref:Uncharacterized protein n=1 Tax=Zooshikella ganghwensis TaxID=202772 RepID=A0A4P9VKJ0_9GAMM|nr:hypothetical protein B9G39_10375 [Zooshikella ganghwensis]